MATISNTPRPGYVWDATDNVWYPIGTGPHSHADYITSGSAINPNIVDAKGDIIAATAADTVARLAVGSNDQVLTADSSTATGLKWATPSSGGMTLISTTTLTGASVSLTSIPQTYNHLQLVIRDFLPATDAAYIRMQYNSDTNVRYNNNTSFGLNQATFNDDAHYASASQDSTLADGISIIQIYDYANTTTWKLANLWSIQRHESTANTFRYANMTLNHNQTIAISSIQLFPDSGNFTSGTVLLYGVK